MRWERSVGDVDAVLSCAAHRVQARHRIPRLVAAPIEPRGVVAAYDDAGDLLTVWASAQDPHRPLSQLAHALDRPPERIRVVVPDVGGAFGSKGVIAVEAVTVAVAAMELGRPLKWVEDRVENFLGAYQGRGVEASVELALDAGGRILAVRAAILADLGAYLLPTTAIPPHTTAMLMTGCYDIPVAEVSVRGARTDKVPTGPYRGAGRPEAAYLLELTVDRAARELGLEPGRASPAQPDPLVPAPERAGLDVRLGRLRAVPRSRARTGRPEAERRRGRRQGGRDVRRASGGQLGERADIGRRGWPGDRSQWINAARAGARDHVRADRGRPTRGRCRRRRDALRRHCGGATGRRDVREPLGGGGRLRARPGGGSDPRAGGLKSTLADAAAAAGGLEAEARFESDLVFGSGAYAAVVEIERETGALTVRRLAAVDDAGTIINPLLAEGQVVGGAVQGLGAVLMEEAVHDAEGQLRNASFVEYSLPSAVEVPPIVSDVRPDAVAAEPAGGEGDRRGRRDRNAGGDRERGGRRARRGRARPAVHRREAVAGAAPGRRLGRDVQHVDGTSRADALVERQRRPGVGRRDRLLGGVVRAPCCARR